MSSDLILGLSGINERFAVSLVRGGEVLFAVEEDKLRRFRGLGFRHIEPIGSRALDAAVTTAAGGLPSIARVAYVPGLEASAADTEQDTERLARFLTSNYGASPPIEVVDHVDAHCAFERAVHPGADPVLMVGRSRAVFASRPGGAPLLDIPFGIVRSIETLARFIGFGPGQIHHLENMACFGKPRFFEPLNRLVGVGFEKDPQLSKAVGFDRRLPGQPLEPIHFDFAASVNRVLHEQVGNLFESIPEAGRRGQVAVCGGVFQSWSLNDALAARFPESDFVVSFAPGNASGTIGGPLVLSGSRPTALGPYLGPEYSRQDIKAILDNSKVRYALHSAGETVDRVSRALGEGRMVGWFRGRCEFGYRALGSRSVFANPANPYACENLSSYLKRRPSYFAYAVAIAADSPEVGGIDSPYLSRSVSIPRYFPEAPVRVQTVSKARAPELWQLLEANRAHAGMAALLNTSLNYFDEPIACTPRDALKTFYASGLDLLVMEDFLLTKD